MRPPRTQSSQRQQSQTGVQQQQQQPQQANVAMAVMPQEAMAVDAVPDTRIVPWRPETPRNAITTLAIPRTAPARWSHSAESAERQKSSFVAVPAALFSPFTSLPRFAGFNTKKILRRLINDGGRLGNLSPYGILAAYVCLSPSDCFDDGQRLSLCRCLPKIETTHEGHPFRMIVDTGATVNIIRADAVDATTTVTTVKSLPVTSVTGDTQYLSQMTTLAFDICAYPYVFDFYLARTLPADAILGLDAIIEAGWVIDIFHRCLYHLTHALPPIPFAPCPHTTTLAFASATFTLPPRTWCPVRVQWERCVEDEDENELTLLVPSTPAEVTAHGAPVVTYAAAKTHVVMLCNHGSTELRVEKGSPVAEREICWMAEDMKSAPPPKSVDSQQTKKKKTDNGGKPCRVTEAFDFSQAEANWSAEAVTALKRMLREWRHVWEYPEVVGRTTRGEHCVDTGAALPFAIPMRRVAWTERDVIHEEVEKMRAQGVIVESESPWASPPVLVRKKDGSVRFCIDYRRLNELTVADQYPLPRIDDVLDALDEGRYFSVIDLKAGYWQIPMRREDAAKTAFRTADGLFEFTVMPFGLRNAPATFQRLMDVVFSGLKWQGLLVYMDDIIIYSATEPHHLYLLQQVLLRLSQAGLKLNPKKTTLVSCEVKYLGHVVSAEGVKPDPKKVSAVMQLAAPKNVREVRSFLGLAGYYRRFIDAFAAIAAPLYALTKKNAVFKWEAAQQQAFDILKQRLCSAPVLAYPRRDRDFILDCDASDEAAGAVLMQLDEHGKEVVIQFASYTFTGPESRWPIFEKEAYAIVWAVSAFRPYLLGCSFLVRTDNSAASFLRNARQPKLQRWAVALSEFTYVVQHRPGKLHSHVDALSRLPVIGERDAHHDVDVPSVAATAFLVGDVVTRHNSLPSINWASACEMDAECAFLRSFATGAPVSMRDAPQWFQTMSMQERQRFAVQHPYVVFRGFPPRDRPRWFVPQALRRAVIAAHHRGAQGAHLGVNKMTAQLACHFYWPNMASAVRGCIRECERCQRVKAAPGIPRASRMLNRASMWATVAFDFFGPLPRTQRGNQYILVGIDHFSRWPEAVPTRVATSAVVAEFLHARIIAQHGTPKELLTDHGTHFASQVIARLCQRYGIRRLMSTPYTPQSNGIVERFMGYLKNALIALIDQKPKTWDEHLSAVLFAYRATPHPETGESPFYMNKGYDPVIPELRALALPCEQLIPSGWHDTLLTARTALEKIIVQQQEMLANQAAQRGTRFEKGQLVLMKRTPTELQQQHTKLTDKFDHVSRVVRVLPSGVVFKVQPIGGGDVVCVNQRQLRPFYENNNNSDVDTLQPPRLPLTVFSS